MVSALMKDARMAILERQRDALQRESKATAAKITALIY